jgi:hypothetical protein
LQYRRGKVIVVALTKKQNHSNWKYLGPVEHKEELYFKGRKLRAAAVWKIMTDRGYTPEQAAETWDLTVEAIMEAIAYCEQNVCSLNQTGSDELPFAGSGITFAPEVNPR